MLQLWLEQRINRVYLYDFTQQSILDYKLDGSSGLKPKMAFI
jgi:hypothetical protein